MFRLTFVLRETRRNGSEGIFLFAKISNLNIPYYRKLTLYEINANR